GGTTEARELAQCLASRSDCDTELSLAGRTQSPAEQPVPVRRGGFGGVEGLSEYLRARHIDVLVDATHPYAQAISRNAVEAAAAPGTRLLALQRPPWKADTRDRWIEVDDATRATDALGAEGRDVFLTVGRQDLGPFARAPQHRYLIRSVDPVEP